MGLVAPWKWDLPRSGMDPISPALAGVFFTTEQPGKPWVVCFDDVKLYALFVNTFSLSVDCLLVLFIVSFAMQKLLSLIKSHLFIFAFISNNLGGRS